MKKYLLALFLGVNALTIPNLVTNNTQIKGNEESNASLNILAKKTYQSQDLATGFNSVLKVNGNFYTVDIKNNLLEIYQVVNNNLNLLVSYQGEQTFQLGSVQSFNVGNKIYYEAFIKTDQYNVSSTQYFVLDLSTLEITNLGIYKVAPDASRYIYDNEGNKIYQYQNYLIFLHSSRWYVNSSTTIINLTNNQVITKNSNSGVYMSFNEGMLYYSSEKGLTAFNIVTNQEYYLTDTLGQQLYSLYAANNQCFVTGLDHNTNIYYLNQIKIVNDQLMLVKLTQINEGNIDNVFFFNNTFYFAGQEYDHTKDITRVYLYQFKDNVLKTLQTYQIKNALDQSVFYSFHHDYFDIAFQGKHLLIFNDIQLNRYNLSNESNTNKILENYDINSINFLQNQTLFCLTSISKDIISTYIANYNW